MALIKPRNPTPAKTERRPWEVTTGQEEKWEAKLRLEGETGQEVRERQRPGMAPEEIESFIRGHRWTFAKSMPHIPHEYVVKERCRDPVEFERFVVHLRRVGYRWKWRHRWGIYLDWPVNGVIHKFWTMGYPLEMTKIINRAVKDHD